MRVAFVCSPNLALASFRMRVWLVGDALRSLGHEVFMIDVGDHPKREDPSLYDVVVFAKHSRPDVQEDLMKRSGNALTIFDCCDDHLQDWHQPAVMAHYLKMCRQADVVITSTQVLADRIKEATQRTAVVIPEPMENEDCRVPKTLTQIRRLFWHGHRSNLDGLFEVIGQLRDWKLHICTNIRDERDGEDLLRHLAPLHPDAVLASWSPMEIGKGHAACDLVIVPVVESALGHKRYKGNQRAVEASMLGRMAVVTDLPAYDGWSFFRVEDNRYFGEAVASVAAEPAKAIRMIRANQAKAREELIPYEIGKRWLTAIESAFERAAA